MNNTVANIVQIIFLLMFISIPVLGGVAVAMAFDNNLYGVLFALAFIVLVLITLFITSAHKKPSDNGELRKVYRASIDYKMDE